jgi:hypothetical protein
MRAGLVRTGVCAAVCIFSLSGVAKAQILSCGGVTLSNAMRQYGSLRAVQLIANTLRDVSICPAKVRTEAWVEGVAGARSGPTRARTRPPSI